MRVGRRSPSNRFIRLVEPLEVRRLFADIAFFDNNVDIDETIQDGDPASATILRDALEDTLDHDIDRFDFFNPADLRDALQGADLVVLPEIITSRILTDRQYESESVLRDFVTNGGGLITVNGWRGINARFLQNVFGYSQLTTSAGPAVATRTPQADVTEFAFVTRPELPSTPDVAPIFFFDGNPWDINSPKTIYTTAQGGAVVALLPFAGRHDIAYLGVSFGTFQTPTQESNWTDVLGAAVIEVDDTDVPDDQGSPTNVVAVSNGSSNSITLTWTDNTTQERFFEVSYSPSPFGPWTEALTLPANSTTTTVPNLDQNRTYHFRVAAVGAGAAPRYSTVVAATTESASSPAPTPTPTPVPPPTQTPVPNPEPEPAPIGQGPLITITPQALVASVTQVGRGRRASAIVHITNNGTAHYKGKVTIQLEASPDNAVGEDVPVGTATKRVSIKPGLTRRIRVRFLVPESRDILRFQLVATVIPAPQANFTVGGGSILDPRVITVLG